MASASSEQVHRVVLSLCCGRSETELQSSDLCVCLDRCKKSLYAGALAREYLHRVKPMNVFFWHDMKVGVTNLISNIHAATDLPIVVLFQHPSPTKDTVSRSAISAASKECISALLTGYLASLYFVYDVNESKNAWTTKELKRAAISRCSSVDLEAIQVTDAVITSQLDDENAMHPVFGNVKRSGWAMLKRGVEMAFQITAKINNL